MIAIGSDHGGYELKEEIKKYLEEKEIEYIDCGTFNKESVDGSLTLFLYKNLCKH